MNEREIFMAALDRESPDERSRYLDEACADDREIRRRVEALLRSYADSGSFLERPVLADEKTLGFNPATDPPGPQPPADDQPDPPDPSPEPISLDFLQPSDAPGSLGRLGQYEVREVVGRGGMGVVLKANDTKLNRIVALKVLAPELASNPTARKRFVREARAAAAVSHHHVVTIYAVEEDQLPYLAMEFIDGQSLQEKIDRQEQLQLREILRIGHQIAAGLAAAHGQGIIHRDIKPANILLEDGVERVQITDFGLARAVDEVSITRPGEVAGTPQFMSPEQAQGQRVDSRSDLFSLGSVLYTMCTGRPPFRAESTVAVLRRICDETPRPIREVNPDVPEWLVEIIDWLLCKDPDDRFQTAAEVAELLGRHLAHVQDPGSTTFPGRLPAAERRPAGRARGRRFWLAAALILLAVVAGLGLTEATGVTRLTASVIRVATGEGTLVVEVDDPTVSVTIDGRELVIAGAGVKEVRLRPGQHRVDASKDGQPVTTEMVTIQRGGRQVVRVFLDSQPTQPTQAMEDGFVSLFDGKTLRGWHPQDPHYSVESGNLVSSFASEHPYSGWDGSLFSEKQYADFVLRLEYRLVDWGKSTGPSSGVLLRTPAEHLPGLDRMEVQIIANPSPEHRNIEPWKSIKPWQLHGALWGVIAPQDAYPNPPGEWNSLEITCQGRKIRVVFNGRRILDGDLDEAARKPCDGREHPALKRDKGHIGFIGRGSEGRVEYRNIRIRTL